MACIPAVPYAFLGCLTPRFGKAYQAGVPDSHVAGLSLHKDELQPVWKLD